MTFDEVKTSNPDGLRHETRPSELEGYTVQVLTVTGPAKLPGQRDREGLGRARLVREATGSAVWDSGWFFPQSVLTRGVSKAENAQRSLDRYKLEMSA